MATINDVHSCTYSREHPLYVALDCASTLCYHTCMKRKHQHTLDRINSKPTLANIAWNDIENMLRALGADVTQGSGSRVKVELNGVKRVYHEPHPGKEAGKALVNDVAKFLKTAGVK